MKTKDLAKIIMQNVGGKDNVTQVENCMTRLRISVKDGELINDAELKNIEDVLGLVHDEEKYVQVVLGPSKVRDVATEFESLGISTIEGEEIEDDWKKNKQSVQSKQNKNIVNTLRILADIFAPMIPAFIAAGISNGLAKLLGIFIPNQGVVLQVISNMLKLISNGFLSYLAIFTGVNAAKQFKVNTMLGGMIGAASLNSVITTISKLVGWYNAESANDSILATGTGGIIGVVIGVWVLAKVEKWIHKHMPSALDVSFTPLLTMFVVMPIYVLAIMPLAGWLSTLVSSFLSIFLYSDSIIVSAITGYVLAAAFLPLVLFGLHRGLTPIYAIQIEKLGGTTLFPAVAMAGAGQVGAAIALWLKAKKTGNTRLRNVIIGALPAGVLGIGEPLIYGVTLPMLKPFITAGLGAGFGGAYVMIMHVMSTAYSPSGILGVTIMQPECMINFVIGIFISYIMGAIITYFFIKDSEVEAALK